MANFTRIKKVAIMQPYFFPYVGYFQLIEKVDHFIFLDNVNYFKKGFINKNYFYTKSHPQKFILPIKKASQNKLISQLEYEENKRKFLSAFDHIYSKSKNFRLVRNIINETVFPENQNVAQVNARSVMTVLDYLGIEKTFSFASEFVGLEFEDAESRQLAICKEISASVYINPANGMHLYNPKSFATANVDLRRFDAQPNGNFGLLEKFENFNPSILHLLCNLEKAKICELISQGVLS
jgi:hypothetical protein